MSNNDDNSILSFKLERIICAARYLMMISSTQIDVRVNRQTGMHANV